jgi:hypothetical protein
MPNFRRPMTSRGLCERTAFLLVLRLSNSRTAEIFTVLSATSRPRPNRPRAGFEVWQAYCPASNRPAHRRVTLSLSRSTTLATCPTTIQSDSASKPRKPPSRQLSRSVRWPRKLGFGLLGNGSSWHSRLTVTGKSAFTSPCSSV